MTSIKELTIIRFEYANEIMFFHSETFPSHKIAVGDCISIQSICKTFFKPGVGGSVPDYIESFGWLPNVDSYSAVDQHWFDSTLNEQTKIRNAMMATKFVDDFDKYDEFHNVETDKILHCAYNNILITEITLGE